MPYRVYFYNKKYVVRLYGCFDNNKDYLESGPT